MTWRKLSIKAPEKKHFFRFKDPTAFDSNLGTVCTWSRCSSTDFKKMKTFSVYASVHCYLTAARKVCSLCWIVLSALFRPNSISQYWWSPWSDVSVFLSLPSPDLECAVYKRLATRTCAVRLTSPDIPPFARRSTPSGRPRRLAFCGWYQNVVNSLV